MKNADELKKILPKVRGEYLFAEPLDKYTWLNVGGPAEVMFFPEDIDDLQDFLKHKSANIPVFMLGGGSNILVRDGGISGVVIKLKNKNFCTVKSENGILRCGAGLLNASLKKILIENCIGGLEFLCSIPGCIGGAVRSNAGCFGSELADVLVSAKVMNGKGDVFEVQPEEFHFSYRHSEFPAEWIILELSLKAEKQTKAKIIKTIEQNALYRKEHQPQGIRTAGSTFKNPQGAKAWELIKNSGAENLQVGGAKLSSQHCNFLENDGTATAADIEKLCDDVIQKVQDYCGVRLELEVKKVGKE